MSYHNIVVLGLFVVVLFYYLNNTPERTFDMHKCMEIVLQDTSINNIDKGNGLRYYAQRKKFQEEFNRVIRVYPTLTVKLSGFSFFDKFQLDKVHDLLQIIYRRKVHNLVVKVVLNDKSKYEDFVRIRDMAHLAWINCYVLLDYDFYYYNCE